MVISLVESTFVAFDIGNPDILSGIEAIHAEGPSADLYTGAITEQITGETGASSILSRVSREVMDLNRPRGRFNYPAVDQYREAYTKLFLQQGLLDACWKLKQPFLVLSLHGMQNEWKRDLEIGTGYGHYCSSAVKQWFVNQVANVTDSYGVDDIFPGYTFRSVLRDGDLYSGTAFTGFGPNLQTIQLEVSREWREIHQPYLVQFLKQVLTEFQQHFGGHTSTTVPALSIPMAE